MQAENNESTTAKAKNRQIYQRVIPGSPRISAPPNSQPRRRPPPIPAEDKTIKLDADQFSLEMDDKLHFQANHFKEVMHAIKLNDIDKIRDIIAANDAPKNQMLFEQKEQHGWSPLHYAAYLSRIDMIKLIVLKAGVEPNIVNSEAKYQGWTPLHVAALCGHRDMISTLIQLGAIEDGMFLFNSRCPYRATQSPAMLACDNNKPEIAKFIDDEAEKLQLPALPKGMVIVRIWLPHTHDKKLTLTPFIDKNGHAGHVSLQFANQYVSFWCCDQNGVIKKNTNETTELIGVKDMFQGFWTYHPKSDAMYAESEPHVTVVLNGLNVFTMADALKTIRNNLLYNYELNFWPRNNQLQINMLYLKIMDDKINFVIRPSFRQKTITGIIDPSTLEDEHYSALKLALENQELSILSIRNKAAIFHALINFDENAHSAIKCPSVENNFIGNLGYFTMGRIPQDSQGCDALIYNLLRNGGIDVLVDWDGLVKKSYSMNIPPETIAKAVVEAAYSELKLQQNLYHTAASLLSTMQVMQRVKISLDGLCYPAYQSHHPITTLFYLDKLTDNKRRFLSFFNRNVDDDSHPTHATLQNWITEYNAHDTKKANCSTATSSDAVGNVPAKTTSYVTKTTLAGSALLLTAAGLWYYTKNKSEVNTAVSEYLDLILK